MWPLEELQPNNPCDPKNIFPMDRNPKKKQNKKKITLVKWLTERLQLETRFLMQISIADF